MEQNIYLKTIRTTNDMCLRSIFIFLELEVTHVFTDSGKAYKEINKILSSYD